MSVSKDDLPREPRYSEEAPPRCDAMKSFKSGGGDVTLPRFHGR
jgi:hypothetical protein